MSDFHAADYCRAIRHITRVTTRGYRRGYLCRHIHAHFLAAAPAIYAGAKPPTNYIHFRAGVRCRRDTRSSPRAMPRRPLLPIVDAPSSATMQMPMAVMLARISRVEQYTRSLASRLPPLPRDDASLRADGFDVEASRRYQRLFWVRSGGGRRRCYHRRG